MLRSTSTTGALALLLALAGCDAESPPAPIRAELPVAAASSGPGLGGIELSSSPSAASVFLDGRYVGETGPEGPLGIVQPAGSYQVRVSARGHADLVQRLELRAGLLMTARADLAPAGETDSVFEEDVLIDVGQVVRAELAFAPGATAARKPRRFHVFAFHGRPGQARNVVLYAASGPVEIGVLGPDGTILSMEDESKVHGNPPEVLRRRFVLDHAGTHKLVVRAPAGPCRYVLGFEKAVTAFYDGPAPELRRLPGRPE